MMQCHAYASLAKTGGQDQQGLRAAAPCTPEMQRTSVGEAERQRPRTGPLPNGYRGWPSPGPRAWRRNGARSVASSPRSGRALGVSLAGQFVCQIVGIINLAQGLGNSLAMNGDGPGLLLGIDVIQHQRLNVAIEDQADDLGILVDDGTARVAANDVGGADEVERRAHIQLVFVLHPAPRQIEGRQVMMSFRAFVQPGKVRLKRNVLAELF